MSERETMRVLFSKLVKDSSVKRKGLAQISVLKQEKDAILKGKVKEFYASLPLRYSKYFKEKNTNENKNIKANQSLSKKSVEPQQIQKISTPKSKITLEENEFPVVRKTTLMQGDCLFSSVYRAAKEQDILVVLEGCLGIDISQEDIFIQELRNLLSDAIAEDRDGVISDFYENMKSLAETNVNSFEEVFNGLPSWFRDEFESGFPDDIEEFIIIMSEKNRQSENYVGEIEVGIMKKIIEDCGIHLEIHVTPIQKAKKEDEEGLPIIHLINLGPPNYEEGHYEYYSFLTGAKGGSKRKH